MSWVHGHLAAALTSPIRSTTPLTAGLVSEQPGSVKLTINPYTLSLRVQIRYTTIWLLIFAHKQLERSTNSLPRLALLYLSSVCSPRLRHRAPSSTSSRLPFALKGPRAVSLESSAGRSTRRTTVYPHKHGLERSFHTSVAGASAAMSLQDRKDSTLR